MGFASLCVGNIVRLSEERSRIMPTASLLPRKWKKNFLALATDGDGTLVRGGQVGQETVRALVRLRQSGIKIILTTGETPRDFKQFPHHELFDFIVAENGGLLYDPATRKEQSLGDAPPPELLRALRRRGIHPIKKGRVIISTECTYEKAVIEVLKDMANDRTVFRNRHSIMILPSHINKATGLETALRQFRLTPQQVVGVGDAENDIPLIKSCGLGVALHNAVPQLKKHADLVMRHGTGAGVVELIGRLCSGN
jgi:hydroxymethylpyrimidine pyrophosphatase-like HAD family hydrolase